MVNKLLIAAAVITFSSLSFAETPEDRIKFAKEVSTSSQKALDDHSDYSAKSDAEHQAFNEELDALLFKVRNASTEKDRLEADEQVTKFLQSSFYLGILGSPKTTLKVAVMTLQYHCSLAEKSNPVKGNEELKKEVVSFCKSKEYIL